VLNLIENVMNLTSMKKNMYGRLVLFFMLFLLVEGWTEVFTLEGEQDGYYEKNHYYVSDTIVVLSQKTLSFAPGSIVRFGPYGGIIVRGSLVTQGTALEPVVFTSEKDHPDSVSGGAHAFQWIGIEAKKGAQKINLRHTHVKYSTIGLTINDTITTVHLQSVTFWKNGNSGCVIGNSVLVIDNKENYSFTNKRMSVENERVFIDTVITKPRIKPKKYRGRSLRWVSLGVMVGAAVPAIISHVRAEEKFQTIKKVNDIQKAAQIRKESQKLYTSRNILTGVSGAGLLGVGFGLVLKIDF